MKPAPLEYRATSADIDPEVRIVSFGRAGDDVGLALVGGDGDEPCTLEDVELWFGIDDGNRDGGALERATLTTDALTLDLTPRGAAVVGGAREIKVDLTQLEDELPAIVEVLKRLFEGAPDKLTMPKAAKKSARPKKAEAAEPALPASSPALALVKLLTEKKLIELDDGVRPESVAKRMAPLLQLLPEKRAKKETVSFLFDDDEIAEVYADEDLLYALVREFLG